MATLQVKVDGTSFWFESPAGNPFLAERCIHKAKLQAAEKILSARHPLSAQLAPRVQQEIRLQERKSGLLVRICASLVCIDGCLVSTSWEMDRDTDILRREVAHVLSQVFAPEEYRLEEFITDDKFAFGRALLRVFF